MDEDPVHVDLKAAERVVVARLEVRKRRVRHLREDCLPLRASGVEVGQRGIAIHGG